MKKSNKPIAKPLAIIEIKKIIKNNPEATITRSFIEQKLKEEGVNCPLSVLKHTLSKSNEFKFDRDYNSWEIKDESKNTGN